MWDGAFKWSDIFHVWNHSCRQLPKDCTFPHWAKYIGIEKKTVVCALDHDWQRKFLKRPLESPVSPLALQSSGWRSDPKMHTQIAVKRFCKGILNQINLFGQNGFDYTHSQRGPHQHCGHFFRLGKGFLNKKKPHLDKMRLTKHTDRSPH